MTATSNNNSPSNSPMLFYSVPVTKITLGRTVTIAFDIETTGPDHLRHTLMSIGTCVMRNMEVLDRKLFVVRPNGYTENQYNEGRLDINDYTWDKCTFNEFARPNRDVLNATLNNNDAIVGNISEIAIKFADWLYTTELKYDSNVRLVSDNPGFDIRFLTHMMCTAGYLPLEQVKTTKGYKYKSVHDIDSIKLASSMYEYGTVTYWDNPPSWKKQSPFPHDHNPMNDAAHIAYEYECFLMGGSAPSL